MKDSALFYFGTLPGLILQFVGALFYFVIFADASFAQALYGAVKIVILVWPALWVFALRAKLPEIKGKANHLESFKYGVTSGIIIVLLTILIFLPFQDFFMEYMPAMKAKAESLNFLEHYILFSIFLSVAHSFLEEYYWRWFVFRGLLYKFSPVTAAIIGSIGFASHHYIILHAYFPVSLSILFTLAVGIGGLIWCAMYYKTRSLLGSWVSHIFVDAVILGVGYVLIF